MTKKGFLKTAAFLSLFVGLAAGVSAQTTISAGFALSSMSAEMSTEAGDVSVSGHVGAGGNLYVDRLLPISIPLSLGGEIGFDTAKIGEGDVEIRGNVIPILFRVAYHFDLMPKLDLYLVGKIGGAFGFATYQGTSESGFAGVGFGVDAGAAYYFIPRFGLFAEGGFDRYNLKKDDLKTPFNRFVTVGISTKF